jgi:hypothetical protein
MELPCDASFKVNFEALSLSWVLYFYKKEHLELPQLATEVLLLFGTTYVCVWKNIFSNGSN